MKSTSFKRSFAIFNPQNLKHQAMPKARPQPSATVSLRMYVLVVIAVRKNPVTWDTDFSGGLTDRGYTMHEHLDDFGLINMNGRIYDPVLGRFLSPDNHIQAPDNPQNYNRYSYALNNPLKYTDPSGEFIIESIMIAAFINATMQTVSGNVNSTAGFWGSFAVGAASGAAGYGAGLAVSNSIQLGRFVAGAAIGGGSGAASSFVGSAGNAWVGGASFADGMVAGFKGALKGAATGALVGGLVQGYMDSRDGFSFWDGTKTEDITLDAISGNGVKPKFKTYNGTIEERNNSIILRDRINRHYDVEEGDFGIDKITTRTTEDVRVTLDNNYYRVSTQKYIGGYHTYTRYGHVSNIHISPKYTLANITDFKAIAGHELIHGYHSYMGLTTTYLNYQTLSEQAAYTYSFDTYMKAGMWSKAYGIRATAIKNGFWGTVFEPFNAPFFF